MPTFHLHNSLTGRKEEFVPVDPHHVRVYACGPTVYNYAHIGNGRMAVVFDQLVRVLRHIYPKVTYASNITDVDDKIMDAAKETGQPIDLITRKYETIYNDDMAVVGVAAPDVQPRASEHIAEMIAQIEQLIARDHAYAAQGHVLFHVPSYPAYGKLSGRSRDDQIAGARVEVSPFKIKTRRISFCGSHRRRNRQGGIPRGAVADRAGISNARRWRKRIWACRSIFTAAVAI